MVEGKPLDAADLALFASFTPAPELPTIYGWCPHGRRYGVS
jgi:hypothetical protein